MTITDPQTTREKLRKLYQDYNSEGLSDEKIEAWIEGLFVETVLKSELEANEHNKLFQEFDLFQKKIDELIDSFGGMSKEGKRCIFKKTAQSESFMNSLIFVEQRISEKLSELEAPKKGRSTFNNAGKIAEISLFHLEYLSGKKITLTTNPIDSGVSGLSFDFLSSIFNILGIEAPVESQIRKAIKNLYS